MPLTDTTRRELHLRLHKKDFHLSKHKQFKLGYEKVVHQTSFVEVWSLSCADSPPIHRFSGGTQPACVQVAWK